ncbi:MAG TPA: type II toxin-antitoxin system VapC family toxin [Allosphingosinicella sp.]|nr:type II toxin-antitoxin system VapC family toxin [Allosphingosinicella sp.]
MPIILDASVALKLITLEAGTAEAQALLERDDERIAPDWMLAEVASGLVNKIRYQRLEVGIAKASFAALPSFIDRFVASAPLLGRAIDLAAELNHPLYDCVYLQVAIDEDGVVITADEGLLKSARQGGYAGRTERLTWLA